MAQTATSQGQPGGSDAGPPTRSPWLARIGLTRRPGQGGRWRRGWLVAGAAVVVAAVMSFHAKVPNSPGNLGSLLETFLPWVGLAVPALLAGALVRRSATACLAVVLPVVVWTQLFGALFLPGKGGGPHNLRVLTNNVNAGNPDPAGTARQVRSSGADVVALEELTSKALPVYQRLLRDQYPYRVERGTVALWSRYPLAAAKSVDVGLTWTRALRAQVETPHGEVAIYVAHLASVRVDSTGFTADQRNETIKQLGDQIGGDPLSAVVLMGDLNATANDRSLAPITAGLRSAQGAAGSGFGFTWPAGFPMARIDHILVRGLKPAKSWVMPRSGSDHRATVADLRI